MAYFAGYNPQRANASKFFEDVEKDLDRLISQYEQTSYWKISMSNLLTDLCKTYGLKT